MQFFLLVLIIHNMASDWGICTCEMTLASYVSEEIICLNKHGLYHKHLSFYIFYILIFDRE